MAAHKDRIDRLNLLTSLIPREASGGDFPDARTLLTLTAERYDHHASPEARLRAIQRDLQDLVGEGRVGIVNPKGKPLRFRRGLDLEADDVHLWNYARQLMVSLVREALPEKRLERVWARLRDEGATFGLGEDKLRVLSDSQRLIPADVREEVLVIVLEALAQGQTLQAGYRDNEGTLTRPVLHPQALLQRGPRLYLFALKNDESEPVRMYALHRFISAKPGQAPAREAEGFSLEKAVQGGQADFAGGGLVDLELRVRGYVADLLHDCALSEDQVIEAEPEGSPFAARVRATVPGTGQLLRWILGCGANVEVVAPARLRAVVAGQVEKMRGLYGG